MKFKNLDIFGQRVKFNFNSKTKHKTNCGAIVTILIAMFMIVAAYVLGQELYKKENPSVTEDQILIYNNSTFKLSLTDVFTKIQIVNKDDTSIAYGLSYFSI
jgi:hypothetical protein